MSKILHRFTGSSMPKAVAGHGIYIVDSLGKSYIDGSGGAAVSCLGHGHVEVLEAMRAQMERIACAHTSFFTTDVAESLTERGTALAPEGLNHMYLVSGGSEAVEAAIKMARQYFVEIGQPQRRHIIARRQSYHGDTIGAARLAQELEGKILELGPDEVIAFVAEPVVGATLGAVSPVADYFVRVRQICDKYGVLLILDEVMCGMGRTGTLFACEQEQIIPDLVTIAKGLGGGFQPIGAVLVSDVIYRAFAEGSGLFQHGHTYIGHPIAAAAANKIVEILARPGMMERVREMGERLHASLYAALGQSPHVGDIRGRGLFRGIELVADKETKTPFDPTRRVHARIKREAMAVGLLCYPMGGTIDGIHGDHVLLAPPYIVTPEEIDLIVERLATAIDAALRE